MRKDTYTITVACDKCQPRFWKRAEATVTAGTLTQCLRSLKGDGWHLGRSQQLCPKHAAQLPVRKPKPKAPPPEPPMLTTPAAAAASDALRHWPDKR